MFMGKGARLDIPLRQERNVPNDGQDIALLTELERYFRAFQSINISFLRNWFRVGAGLILTISLIGQIYATQQRRSLPAAVNVSSQRLGQMDLVIEQAIAQQHLPGAVVLVGRRGRVVWEKAYGARATELAREPMTTDTIFDMASLTKVVAT